LSALERVKNDNYQIDLACCLNFGSFVAEYKKSISLRKSTPDAGLVFFYINLLKMLGDVGTVCAIDYTEYEKSLQNYEKQVEKRKNSGKAEIISK